jgi:hypothetical protein
VGAFNPIKLWTGLRESAENFGFIAGCWETGRASGIDLALSAVDVSARAVDLALVGVGGIKGLSAAARWLTDKCFVAGTPVLMADGSTKPIEQIRVGDRVLSRDPETGVTTTKRVTNVFERETDETLTLTLADGERIETTSGHPFNVEGRGFVAAGELGVGTSIVTRAGPARQVKEVEWRFEHKKVYNFEVEGFHSYFVGRGEGAVWVHNGFCAFTVGSYGELVKGAVGMEMQAHKLPQAHLAEQLPGVFPGYTRTEGLAILMPEAMHTGLPVSSRLKGDLSGLTNHEVRALVAQQLRDLAAAGVPRKALQKLGRELTTRYPGLYVK